MRSSHHWRQPTSCTSRTVCALTTLKRDVTALIKTACSLAYAETLTSHMREQVRILNEEEDLRRPRVSRRYRRATTCEPSPVEVRWLTGRWGWRWCGGTCSEESLQHQPQYIKQNIHKAPDTNALNLQHAMHKNKCNPCFMGGHASSSSVLTKTRKHTNLMTLNIYSCIQLGHELISDGNIKWQVVSFFRARTNV